MVPPDLIQPAQVSKPSRKEITPEEEPPEVNGSPAARIELKFVPVPDPCLNNLISDSCKAIIESIVSSTD